MKQDTIVAVATPPGHGGVAICRLSGSQALAISQQLTQKKSFTPRFAHFSSFYSHSGQVIDEGLALYFPGPNSFTGEDVVELHSHGSPVVLDLLIKSACQLGARIAKPGEFSERAFLNDKIDLVQAEAIADLIHAHSSKAAQMAMRSLQGEFSSTVQAMSQKMIRLRMYVEAAIDFPEEEIDFLSDGKLNKWLQDIIRDLEDTITNATQGVIAREGISVVIAGKPNAGKSTLINALSKKEVAIVTDIPGTTRDVMKEHVLLDDLSLHLIDTAGLRNSQDPIEQEGIRRAWAELKNADCVLYVIDALDNKKDEQGLSEEIKAALPARVPIIHLKNKVDQLAEIPKDSKDAVYVSAKEKTGLSSLTQRLKEAVGYHPSEGQFLARRRHLSCLQDALKLLLEGQRQLTEHRAGELLAEDLRIAHQSLGDITGEYTSDDLLGEIFSSFCIGK